MLCLSQARAWISICIYCGLFWVQWIKIRSNCSFCWYWWNCLKFIFIIDQNMQIRARDNMLLVSGKITETQWIVMMWTLSLKTIITVICLVVFCIVIYNDKENDIKKKKGSKSSNFWLVKRFDTPLLIYRRWNIYIHIYMRLKISFMLWTFILLAQIFC